VSAAPGVGLAEALASREELLGHCVHCGFCLPACPTYQELGDEADSPRGRLHLMRAVVEERLDPGAEAFQTHLDRCLGCRACESVCPSGVEYGHLLEHARAVAVEARPQGLLTRLLLWTMASPTRARLFGLGGRLFRATGIPGRLARTRPGLLRTGMAMLAASEPPRGLRGGPLEGDARKEDAPRRDALRRDALTGDAKARMDTRHAPQDPGASASGTPAAAFGAPDPRPAPGSMGRVHLLTGCVQDGLFRRVHEATRKVLEVNGWEVLETGPGCCGALHAHAGEVEKGEALAREILGRSGTGTLVANAAGCGAHLRDQAHPDPQAHGQGQVHGPAQRQVQRQAEGGSSDVADISELLAGEGRTPVRGAPLPLRVVYDPPCHLLHAQRVADPPLRLLRGIPGLELLPLRDGDRCCGGAGIYGITHPELGGRIGADKVDAIVESGADWVATGNPGCQMQIGAGLRMRGSPVQVVHPVELLAESYRRAGW
jgi:glycolate oxidase iron-sulfur subunit